MKNILTIALIIICSCKQKFKTEESLFRSDLDDITLRSDCTFVFHGEYTLPIGKISHNIPIDTVKERCQPGWSFMPSLETSSLSISADTCLPDSTCKKLWLEFSKNLCGETSFGYGGDNFSYSSINTWSDSTGCSTKETYSRKIKGKWVEISEDEYYKYNKRPEIISTSIPIKN